MFRSAAARPLAFATTLATVAVLLCVPASPGFATATRVGGSGMGAPPPRGFGGMAEDPAHGQIVLFGGEDESRQFADTWTWDGAAWTKETPIHSPSARSVFGMVWDAATATVVLFGGYVRPRGDVNDTWTWDGTDWTKETPMHAPPARHGVSMAYDAARGVVVLFGGCCKRRGGGLFRDTWTWDGSDWTRRSPAKRPNGHSWAAMSWDGAHDDVVLSTGASSVRRSNTWTWDGTNWMKRNPAHTPKMRFNARMAYDAADGEVVLFGGFNDFRTFGDTWTWDGTDWTERHPPHAPTRRGGPGFAYDAGLGRIVLFGGEFIGYSGDTWTWDGTDWTQSPDGSIQLSSRSGPPGGNIVVFGSGFLAGESVSLKFVDSVHGTTLVEKVGTDATGGFGVNFKIPGNATAGSQRVKATGIDSGSIAKRGFTVT